MQVRKKPGTRLSTGDVGYRSPVKPGGCDGEAARDHLPNAASSSGVTGTPGTGQFLPRVFETSCRYSRIWRRTPRPSGGQTGPPQERAQGCGTRTPCGARLDGSGSRTGFLMPSADVVPGSHRDAAGLGPGNGSTREVRIAAPPRGRPGRRTDDEAFAGMTFALPAAHAAGRGTFSGSVVARTPGGALADSLGALTGSGTPRIPHCVKPGTHRHSGSRAASAGRFAGLHSSRGHVHEA